MYRFPGFIRIVCYGFPHSVPYSQIGRCERLFIVIRL
nr:MAG TPA: hypothetical protein [Caudoviricetes sp.]